MRKVILAVSEVTRAWFLETWLSLTKDYAKFEARFSCQRTCNSRLQNTLSLYYEEKK